MKRVIVEMSKAPAGSGARSLAAPSFPVGGIDLPGFRMDAEFGAVPIDGKAFHGEDQVRGMGVASAMTRAPKDTIILRGTIDADSAEDLAKAKARIAREKDVIHVWDDGIVEAFGCNCGGGCGGGAAVDRMMGAQPGLPSMDQIMGNIMPAAEGASVHSAMMGHGAMIGSVAMAASPCEPTDCASGVAKGTIADVAAYLNCHRLWARGIRGQGVAVGIVDTGIDKSRIANVTDGWSPDPSFPWGTDPGGHGSMCATDAKGMAPDIELYDIGLLKSGGNAGTGFLSDAILAFQWAINKYRTTGKPQILSNSWGMFQEAWAPDYVRDPNHPFTRKVVEAINEGMIVTFAAGNCGQVCPSGRCGSDTGPGRSIWGANGHPMVITVGAANIREEWIGYSSQGPAALDPRKPDFVSPSHFKGWTPSDNGTSAANPVCAGVIALLRGHDPGLRQAAAKEALQATAKDLCGGGWDPHSGAGMINAERAFNKLNFFVSPLVHACWTHGHSAHAELPEALDEQRCYGFYSVFRGKPDTYNWFHFALPTPVIVDNRRLALDSVMLLFWTDPSVSVHAVQVWDANNLLKRYDGLNLTGSHWFERFDVLNNRVAYGIGVSVGVRFNAGNDPRRIIFGSCGGDFLG